MSKVAPAAQKQPPTVTVDASERERVKPSDTYETPNAVTLPLRIRRGNNEYDLVLATFPVTPASVRVLRSRRSRVEVDYELKVLMQNFIGPNRFGPSGDE